MGATPTAKYEPERVEPSGTPLPNRSESVPAAMFNATDRLLAAIKDMDR